MKVKMLSFCLNCFGDVQLCLNFRVIFVADVSFLVLLNAIA